MSAFRPFVATGCVKGDYVFGRTRPAREGEKFAAIQNVLSVNDMPVEETAGHRPKFAQLTPVYPDERLLMEARQNHHNCTRD